MYKRIKDYFKSNPSRLYVRLIVLVYLLFSYNTFPGWWYSLIGTLLIILLARICWEDEYLEWIGLRIEPKAFFFCLLFLIVIAFGSFQLITFIARGSHVSFSLISFTAFLHIIGYTLNEEIVLGAILINFIQKRFKKLNQFYTSILVAVAFPLLHYIFYRWIFLDKGIICISSLVSLFAVGAIRNNLILRTGHIGYSWALHVGWAFIMFGFVHTKTITTKILSEPEKFNLYLGSPIMVLILTFMAILSFLLLLQKRQDISRA